MYDEDLDFISDIQKTINEIRRYITIQLDTSGYLIQADIVENGTKDTLDLKVKHNEEEYLHIQFAKDNNINDLKELVLEQINMDKLLGALPKYEPKASPRNIRRSFHGI